MKKNTLFIIFALVFCALFPLSKTSNIYAEEPTTVRVVANQTDIYSAPNITSEILVLGIKQGTVLTVVSDAVVDYKLFYKVLLDGFETTASEGYVLKAHTLDNSITSPEKSLDDNAKIKNDNTKVFELVGEEYVETNIILSKGEKIRILDGYDSSKTYHYISFIKDENIVSYYVKTENIEVSGINYTIIVAVMTLITCASVLSIVLGIKAKKKRKKKQKNTH